MSARRPLPLRASPLAWRTWMFYRFYRQQRARRPDLYASAPLHHAPDVRMSLMPSDEGHACIAFTGVYELDLTKRIVAAARRGGTLVDVGANYGYYSLLWAAQHPSNRAVAFEASPRNFEPLEHNVVSNGFDRRVERHHAALGGRSGQMAFDLGPREQCGWGGLAGPAARDTVDVDVLRLDDFWQRDDDIDLLKIDVEGADTWVLHGAEGLLRRRAVKVVYYEQNKPRLHALGIGEGEAESFLRNVGYDVTPLSDPSSMLVEFRAVPSAA